MNDMFNSSKRKYFRAWDLLVVFVVILVAVLSVYFLWGRGSDGGGLVAVIRVDKEVYAEVRLSEVAEPYEISVPVKDGEVRVRLSEDGVQVVSSPCSDKLCVNTGKLFDTGQSAVCLPERVSVQIVSDSQAESSLDAVAG